MTPKAILFYDGNCALCHGAVLWALNRKALDFVVFSPLQGQTALKHLPQNRIHDLNTVVFYSSGEIYIEAAAVFELLRSCTGLWKLLSLFRLFPLSLTNSIYRWVARNRFHWRKPLEGCPLPDPTQKHRFLP